MDMSSPGFRDQLVFWDDAGSMAGSASTTANVADDRHAIYSSVNREKGTAEVPHRTVRRTVLRHPFFPTREFSGFNSAASHTFILGARHRWRKCLLIMVVKTPPVRRTGSAPRVRTRGEPETPTYVPSQRPASHQPTAQAAPACVFASRSRVRGQGRCVLRLSVGVWLWLAGGVTDSDRLRRRCWSSPLGA